MPSSCCSALQSLKSVAARALPACRALAAVAWGSALGRLPPDSPEPAGEGPTIVAGEAPASCWTSSLLHLKAARGTMECQLVHHNAPQHGQQT